MGLSCKSKAAVAVSKNPTQDSNRNNGGILENFKFRDLEAATNWFARENLIFKASHGHIYRGVLLDGRVVAVKRPESGARSCGDADAFNNEVQILSKLFSRRLVNLLGCSQDGRVKLLVLEYMENGTLYETLKEPAVGSSAGASLSWPMRVKLALDIAKAIRALHASSPPIIHSNIRSTNVFIDRDGNARLGDFCLAKCMPNQLEPPRKSLLISIPEIANEDAYYGRHSNAGWIEDYVDVENEDFSSSSSSVTSRTDVFSFGVILLEIMSGRSINHGASPDVDQQADAPMRTLLDWALPLIKYGHSMAICDPRITPFPDSAAVRIMANTAARCVRSSSLRRLSMEEVVRCLAKASKLVPEPVWINPTPSAGFPEIITSQESLIPHHTPSRQQLNARSITTSVWTPFPNLKKKRTLVFRLSRFFVRKFRIGARRSSYEKLPPLQQPHQGEDMARKKFMYHRKASPLKGAKVSPSLRDRSDTEQDLEHHNNNSASHKGCRENFMLRVPTAGFTRFSGSSSHRYGKKFVRL